MAAHVVIIATWCALVNPAVDKIAGAFPKLLPLQIVTTISDITCVVVLHVPTLTNILGILSDLGTVVSDLPSRGSFPVTRRSPRIGMKR